MAKHMSGDLRCPATALIYPLSLNMPLSSKNSLRELTVSPNKSVSRRCNYVDADHIKSTNTWGRVSQILR